MFILRAYELSLDSRLKIIYIFSVYIKLGVGHNDERILNYLDVLHLFIDFICRHIKPVDNILNIQSLFSLIKTILLFLTNIYLCGSDRPLNMLIHTFGNILLLISRFDKVFLSTFIHYFVVNMLDFFIDIFKGNNEVRFEVIRIFDILLDKIMKLNNHIKQELLGKFKKWFILMIQTYVFTNEKNIEFMDGGDYKIEYRVHPYVINDWYYTEEVLFNIFFEMLPWLNTRSLSMDFFSLYIFEMYKNLKVIKENSKCCSKDNTGFSRENISFLSNLKLQLSQKLIDDVHWIEEGKMITPSWYDQLLHGITLRFNKDNEEEVVSEDIRKGVEKLVNIYKENNNNFN